MAVKATDCMPSWAVSFTASIGSVALACPAGIVTVGAEDTASVVSAEAMATITSLVNGAGLETVSVVAPAPAFSAITAGANDTVSAAVMAQKAVPSFFEPGEYGSVPAPIDVCETNAPVLSGSRVTESTAPVWFS